MDYEFLRSCAMQLGNCKPLKPMEHTDITFVVVTSVLIQCKNNCPYRQAVSMRSAASWSSWITISLNKHCTLARNKLFWHFLMCFVTLYKDKNRSHIITLTNEWSWSRVKNRAYLLQSNNSKRHNSKYCNVSLITVSRHFMYYNCPLHLLALKCSHKLSQQVYCFELSY